MLGMVGGRRGGGVRLKWKRERRREEGAVEGVEVECVQGVCCCTMGMELWVGGMERRGMWD